MNKRELLFVGLIIFAGLVWVGAVFARLPIRERITTQPTTLSVPGNQRVLPVSSPTVVAILPQMTSTPQLRLTETGIAPTQFAATLTTIPRQLGSTSISPTSVSTPIPQLPSPTRQTITQTATSPANLTPKVESGQPCTDRAAFFEDVTIPDNTPFFQNVSFKKTWRIRNEGTCTWGAGYALVFFGGNAMDGSLSNPIPEIAPGQVSDISIILKSPASAGTFTGHWVFQNPAGKRFGVNSNGIDTIWVKIGVRIYDEQKTPVPVVGGSSASTPPASCAAQENRIFEEELLTQINQERQKAGLPVLKASSLLAKAAFLHSQDMGCNQFVDHVGSNGSTWYTRIASQGYAYRFATENIYVGDPQFGGNPAGAMKWWLNSKIHRDNILNARVTEIGIGYTYIPTSPYKGYYTLNFALP